MTSGSRCFGIRSLASSTLSILPYVLFSIYLILYAVLFLTIIRFPIYPTLNRVTIVGPVVSWSFTESLQQDILIALIMYATAIPFLFRKNAILYLSIAIAGSSLAGFYYSQSVANIALMSSLPAFLIILIVSRYVQVLQNNLPLIGKQYSFNVEKLLLTFFAVFWIFELLVFFRWLIYPTMLDLSYSHWSWKLNLLENDLFYAFGSLSPYLLILSTVSFVIKPYIRPFSRRFTLFTTHSIRVDPKSDPRFHISTKLLRKFAPLSTVKKIISLSFQNENKTLFFVLLFAGLPSILISIYPYTVVKSPEPPGLGTDIHAYSQWLNILQSSTDLPSFLYQLFVGIDNGSRPLSLFVMYSLSALSGQSSETVLKYFPAMLGPSLVLAVYILTRSAYPENRKIALIASIMTAFSHQVVVGFYGAFYANWLALIMTYISVMFMLKSLGESNHYRRNIALFATFSLLSLFFHSYTWSYSVAAIVLFLVWTAIDNKRANRNVRVILILSVVTSGIVMVDIIKSYYSGSTGGFQKDLSIASDQAGLDQFSRRWNNLQYAFRFYLGGFLTNSAVLLLLFLWTLKAKYSDSSDRFFLSSLFVALVPILFGDYVVQSRILYNVPFQIPASIMLYKMYTSPRIPFSKPLFYALLFIQINYAFRAMANMYFISPL